MIVKTALEVDLQKPSPRSVLYAVQNDGQTRAIELSILNGGSPWEPPKDTTVAISFRKPDGTSGLYDTLPDGTTKAAYVSGSKVTATLAPQVLTCAGRVDVSIVLYDSTLNRLGVFPIPLFVSEDPSAGQKISNDYYNFSTLAELNEAINGKAPDGYGLGVGSYSDLRTRYTSKEELDAIDGNSFFSYRNPNVQLVDGDTATVYGFGVHYQYTSSFAKQVLTTVYYPTTIERQKIDGKWGEWEYSKMNLVMDISREYRTTERWQSKAVYVKHFKFGTMPNATTKTVALGTTRTNDIRWSGVMRQSDGSGQGIAFPYNKGNGDFVDCCVASNSVYITSGQDLSTWTGYITLYYTKD